MPKSRGKGAGKNCNNLKKAKKEGKGETSVDKKVKPIII